MQKTLDTQTTLLEALRQMAPESSATTLRSWIKEGRVEVAGQVVKRADHVVDPQQTVKVGPKSRFLFGDVRVLYEDWDLIVLEKPAGLLSVATDEGTGLSVHGILKREFTNRRVYPVHRLDRETSGVMVFVFGKKMQDAMKKQFEQHEVGKVYYAVVEGELKVKQGRWESHLAEDERYFVRSGAVGKWAVTEYEEVAVKGQRSLLRLKPLTGRKNQLRVHCADAGHPIVGDKKYGAVSNTLKRLGLHAAELSFTHPASEKRLSFSVPAPFSI